MKNYCLILMAINFSLFLLILLISIKKEGKKSSNIGIMSISFMVLFTFVTSNFVVKSQEKNKSTENLSSTNEMSKN